MGKKETIVKKLKGFKNALKKKIAIDSIIFFGSRAYGRPHRDSDIDLIIVSKDFERKKFRERAIGFYKYWDLDYAVDFLCYTPEEFKKLSKQVTLVSEALLRGIRI